MDTWSFSIGDFSMLEIVADYYDEDMDSSSSDDEEDCQMLISCLRLQAEKSERAVLSYVRSVYGSVAARVPRGYHSHMVTAKFVVCIVCIVMLTTSFVF